MSYHSGKHSVDYEASVIIGELDPDIALEKAERIYDMLGPGFFRVSSKREDVIPWIVGLLRKHDFQVNFYNANDAMMFKLAFGGS